MQETGIAHVELDRNEIDGTRFHAGRSAAIRIGDDRVGTIGQVSRTVEFAFGLDVTTVIIELDFEKLLNHFSTQKTFMPLPLYPIVKRDLAFVVGDRVEFASIESEIKKISVLIGDSELFDTYRGKGIDPDKKSLAVHLSFRAEDRTLDAAEVDVLVQEIRRVLENTFGATMRM